MSRRSSSRSQTSRKRKSNADVSESFEFEKSAFRFSKRHSTSNIAPTGYEKESIPNSMNSACAHQMTSDPEIRLGAEPTSRTTSQLTCSPPSSSDHQTDASSFSVAIKPLSSRRRRTIADKPSQQSHRPLTFHERNYLVSSPSRADNFVQSDDAIRSKGPLPKFAWADSEEVWKLMLKKDRYYCRDSKLFEKHKALEPRMRSILFDWIVEVSEVYQLHRETFYLAMDFVDRYLSKISTPLQKQQLQLIGVTCLFIASKMEEIYPPRIAEFAFVTDQACDIDEILSMEHLIIKVLDWDLAPVTVIAWLNLILQLSCHLSNNSSNKSTTTTTTTCQQQQQFQPIKNNNNNGNHSDTSEPQVDNLTPQGVKPHPHHDCGIGNPFLQPIFSAIEYIQIARLLDLCMLDEKCLGFKYSIIAASAYYLMSNIQRRPLSDIGFEWIQICSCVEWLSPFATVLRSRGDITLTRFEGISVNHSHNIQTNVIDLDLLEEVRDVQNLIDSENSRLSPDLSFNSSVAMTPPASSTRRQSLSKSMVVVLDTVTESISEAIPELDEDAHLVNNYDAQICL